MSKRRKGLYGFNSFSERGAWVEMMFMAAASFRGYRVLTPWEEGLPYDVAIEENGQVLRIQVKSTTCKAGAGYRCDFLHSSGGRIQGYDADELDVCAGYVVPEQVWYIIPAHRVTGCTGKSSVTLCQFEGVRNHPKYEDYREAWALLGKDRSELAKE